MAGGRGVRPARPPRVAGRLVGAVRPAGQQARQRRQGGREGSVRRDGGPQLLLAALRVLVRRLRGVAERPGAEERDVVAGRETDGLRVAREGDVHAAFVLLEEPQRFVRRGQRRVGAQRGLEQRTRLPPAPGPDQEVAAEHAGLVRLEGHDLDGLRIDSRRRLQPAEAAAADIRVDLRLELAQVAERLPARVGLVDALRQQLQELLELSAAVPGADQEVVREDRRLRVERGRAVRVRVRGRAVIGRHQGLELDRRALAQEVHVRREHPAPAHLLLVHVRRAVELGQPLGEPQGHPARVEPRQQVRVLVVDHVVGELFAGVETQRDEVLVLPGHEHPGRPAAALRLPVARQQLAQARLVAGREDDDGPSGIHPGLEDLGEQAAHLLELVGDLAGLLLAGVAHDQEAGAARQHPLAFPGPRGGGRQERHRQDAAFSVSSHIQ